MRMKTVGAAMLMTVAMLILPACGGQEAGTLVPEEYLVLEKETTECLLLGEDLQGTLLGSQFYEGEIVQFWSVMKQDENRNKSLDIYLCKESTGRQLIFENVDMSFGGRWFWDKDSNYYILGEDELVKVDSKGNLFFRKQIVGGRLLDICQLSDGRVFLMKHMDEGDMKVVSLDVTTGDLNTLDYVALGEDFKQGIAAGESGLMLLNAEGIWSIEIANGAKTKLIELAEYDYAVGMLPYDFRVSNENAAEILYSGSRDNLLVQDVAKTRTIITVKAEKFFNDTFMQEKITLFNRTSETYYVVADIYEEGEEQVDFRTKTNVEIGAGGGPDIMR